MALPEDERISEIVNTLKERHETGSYNSDPFRVLIFTILSQRTKDENTARAGERLFSVFETPHEMADADEAELQRLIKPSGFYKVKARRIKEVSKIISKKYGGSVPDDLVELLSLPGVGRKTANCVLVYGFGKKAIPVDVHVHRISNRLGLVGTKRPEETEKGLMKKVPRRFWRELNELFVKFGQDLCRPINPKCNECDIRHLCKFGSNYGRDLFRKR
ncbi:MAG: endonuclease III domain-containing protein [Candidatus Hydrothermarchaeales archaeon]